ncbi:MAG: tape measure protein, partial [Armatimonadota bacterium]|nr:tape measure protein [Armatimonadota bacterium]MDW8144304.1 tape measure protein [Armatimonadota bacterium]
MPEELTIRIRAQGSEQVQQALLQIRASVEAIGQATQKVAPVMTRLGENLRAIGERMRRVGSSLSELSGKMSVTGALWTASVGAAVGAMVKYGSEIQRTKVSFETLLKSQEKANRLFQELTKFAAQTPFERLQVMQLAQQFLGVGIAVERVIPLLRSVGDAVAGVGGSSFELERATRALTQIVAKGRVQMEEMLQLMEARIPVFQILRNEMGLTEKQISQLGRQGIAATEFLDAFQKFAERRFGGQMVRMMGTIEGAMSNLRDAIQNFFGTLGEAIAPALVPVINQLTEALSKITKSPEFSQFVKNFSVVMSNLAQSMQNLIVIVMKLVNAFAQLPPSTQQAIMQFTLMAGPAMMVGGVLGKLASTVLSLGGAVVSSVGTILTWIGKMIGGWGTVVSVVKTAATAIVAAVGSISAPIAAVLAAIAAAVGAFALAWRNNWFGIRDIVSNVWNVIRETVKLAWEQIKLVVMVGWTTIKAIFVSARDTIAPIANKVWDVVKSGATAAWGAVKGIVMSAWNSIKTVLVGIKNFLVSLGIWEPIAQAAQAVVEKVKGFFGAMWDWIKGLGQRIANWWRNWIKETLGNEAAQAIDEQVKRVQQQGQKVAEAVSEGMQKGKKQVGKAADEMTEEVRKRLPKSPPETGPLKDIVEASEKIPELIAQGMQQGKESVANAADVIAGSIRKNFAEGLEDVFSSFEEAIADALAGVGRLSNAFKNLWQDIKRQFWRVIVQELLSPFLDWLRNWARQIGEIIFGSIFKRTVLTFGLVPTSRSLPIPPLPLPQFAGVGAAMAASAMGANKELSALAGAAVGFAVGGPVGAIIGGLA